MKRTHIILIGILLLIVFIWISLIFGGDDSKKLSGGYSYDPQYHHILGTVDIPPNILCYDYNKNFIIAKQKPKEFHEAIYDDRDYVYNSGRDHIYYWLIIHKENLVLGPMDSTEYIDARKRYDVPDKLKLE